VQSLQAAANKARLLYERKSIDEAIEAVWTILKQEPASPVSSLGFKISRETRNSFLADQLRAFLESKEAFNGQAKLDWVLVQASLGQASRANAEISELLSSKNKASFRKHVANMLAAHGYVAELGHDSGQSDSTVEIPAVRSEGANQAEGESGEQPVDVVVKPSPLHLAIANLAQLEIRDKTKKLNYFLLRLIDRMSTEPLVAKQISGDGLLVSDVQRALSLVDGVPEPRQGHTFIKDLFWAAARSRRSNLSDIWIEDGHLPTARLVVRERVKPTFLKRKRKVDARDAFSVGEIRWVQLHESKRGIRSELHHPAVIVEKAGANKWRVVSLTSNVEGEPEGRRVPQAAAQGLTRSGYVWHETQKVFVSELGDHIGWVHPELVEVIRRSVRIRTSLVEELVAIAAEKHP
jgi:hypothetical protein